MTSDGNDPQGAKHIFLSWFNAGWKTGVILGGTYGAVYGAIAGSGFFWVILIGLALGCVIGFIAGLVLQQRLVISESSGVVRFAGGGLAAAPPV
jgi:ABC-type phosphate transport system permease subunit